MITRALKPPPVVPWNADPEIRIVPKGWRMIFVHQPGFSEVVLCLDLASLLQVSGVAS